MTDAMLVRSHVVDDPTEVFERALSEGLTGHAVVEPQDAFLLGDDDAARVTFVDGVPLAVVETRGDRAGPAAVETFTGPGPFGVEVYRGRDERGDGRERARVPPDLPARRLGDADLATRTRAAAPGDVAAAEDPVSAFLADADAVESIRTAAREEAVADAEAWGLTDHLADDDGQE